MKQVRRLDKSRFVGIDRHAKMPLNINPERIFDKYISRDIDASGNKNNYTHETVISAAIN